MSLDSYIDPEEKTYFDRQKERLSALEAVAEAGRRLVPPGDAVHISVLFRDGSINLGPERVNLLREALSRLDELERK